MMQYNKKVMEIFRKPKHVGVIKNPDGYSKVGNPTCLIPNSKIQTNPSLTEISSLKKGDLVLSHDGKYNKITKTFKRKYSGNLISIKNGLGITTLTPDHLVNAIIVPKNYKFLHIKNKKSLFSGWYHAEHLKRNDILVYPISKKIKDIKEIKIDVPKYKWDFRSVKIPDKIFVNDDFLRLAGYFIAEGHTNLKITKCHLSLSFGSHEKEYISDSVKLFKKIFGINAILKTKKEKHLTRVNINNVHVARFFNRLFGNHCTNKNIPEFMLFLPLEKQKELIKGLWRGDGFFNSKIPRAGFATVSYKLAQQVKFLLIRQGIIPSLYIEKAKKDINGVNHREAYRIHVGSWSVRNLAKLLDETINDKKLANRSWADNNYIYLPIKIIKKEKYDNYVHNLEVEKAHSYATDSLLVHNCGDMMEVFIKIKNNKIIDAKFRTYGCVAAVAASDALCELIIGKTVEEALRVTDRDIVKYLGNLPAVKFHCSVLGKEGLTKAIDNYKKKNKN